MVSFSENVSKRVPRVILFLPSHCQVQYKLYDVHCTVHPLSTQPLPGTVQIV